MNKQDFIRHIARENKILQEEATRILNIFTSSVISALGKEKEIAFMGFGRFYNLQVPEKKGRNPTTSEAITVKAYTQAKFSPGQKLKAVNKRKR